MILYALSPQLEATWVPTAAPLAENVVLGITKATVLKPSCAPELPGMLI